MKLINPLLDDSMAMSFTHFSMPLSASYGAGFSARSFPVASEDIYSVESSRLVPFGGAASFCRRFCGLKLRIFKSLQKLNRERRHAKEFRTIINLDKDHSVNHVQRIPIFTGQISEEVPKINVLSDSVARATPDSSSLSSSPDSLHYGFSTEATYMESAPSLKQADSLKFPIEGGKATSLCIAVIGATGELARGKIFPALFALYYRGFLPEDVAIFGYSRKNLTDEDLRNIIASNLTCRIDLEYVSMQHRVVRPSSLEAFACRVGLEIIKLFLEPLPSRANCGDKMETFLRRTYYLNGGCDNVEGMSKLNAKMEQIEGGHEANRIFYLSVPQEALLDVASSLADNAQTRRGWNRIIIEKPFGFDGRSSSHMSKTLLSKFEEKQLYRIDHLLGRNLIENLTVLRFSNLVFEPLWSRTYIRNVQIILSEDLSVQTGRYFDGYGIIRDIVHSHMFQTIALLAMEPPVSLDGEDIRNEKVKVLRSIRRLDPSDVILGQYKAISDDKVDVNLHSLTPTYFAAALYVDNARWDGVPFLIKTGIGLIKHRVEIRIQFHHVPGNLYRERIGHNIDMATNELILRDVPDEAILVKINNKIPGLGLQLDASELNLLYKDRYDVEVPDSYEHLLLDVIDGDNHLFMRSDEIAAAWKILTPVLQEIDKKNIAPELYELGGRGPIGAYYLWAKHGVRWPED